MKSIFQFIRHGNIDLHLDYIPTHMNPADAPSRVISYSDSIGKCGISNEMYYDPHSVDLMATDANVMLSTNGQPLKHYTFFHHLCQAVFSNSLSAAGAESKNTYNDCSCYQANSHLLSWKNINPAFYPLLRSA
ncbi:LOW QUALITY PROTEIN: hypothetical protein KUTeg_020406 [Tegillarca granosa]|uniref:Uncharacterized protein n=1 Tax=Tegillarca granosa TaxID=220873 RepID=A0ABQ9E7U8_TEGGR|nr:LOW QUALITY PROTEIN: hypothetical protein KUTeg_020406 [Tegillarca granosa]